MSDIAEVLDTKLITKGGAVTATVETVPDSQASDPNGEFTLRLATPDKDREGDELKRHEWKTPLPDYISIDTDHAMTTEKTIGGGVPKLLDDGSIEVPCTFATTQHGQETRKLMVGKHVRGASATYLQRTLKLKDGSKIVQRELLNGTVTPIPANTKAVVLSSKSLTDGDQSTAAQAIHDQAAKLGAVCGHDDTDDTDTITKSVSLTVVSKSIKGSVDELTDRVHRAVRDAHPDGYPYIRATFLDSPGQGTVVYEHHVMGVGRRSDQTMARGFTDNGTKTTLDEARPVTLRTEVLEHDDETDETVAKTLTLEEGPLQRAADILVAGGMTREAALKHLGIEHTGATLSSTEGSPAVGTSPADEAADESKAAGSQLEMRARALTFELDSAAG